MQMIAIEDTHIVADNLAVSRAVFASGDRQYQAELRLYLQKNDCLGICLGRHDRGIDTSELNDYLLSHKMELRQKISTQIPELRREYRQKLLADKDDINWPVVNAG
ncbi:Uncharacterized [Syntrophomonas zehnderi OL-4]|uniref:Uncharacterized n=1 Tax=Syntrophomonas zehnderi OL-4 TaxID=690567 RepID=A0A0E4GB18_9FIRM|nr:hypothetical protein [Syntrophomonas zehnderi]CFX53196.1 Uncharacterized [Syntrophomonas zehnderi OL-4]